ncbi:MAG: uridine kinase [Candidatus Cloacimonetes bacterium]|jgi:uridine kinase|nr:uridine kinase [Candidatus Cloacimonadota bacterium]MDY0298659.1 uridine kinase [Candidatus Cloacimonadaceae bacterium]MCB5278492.1 uridine kinase [Candidatus Cloacimonadota bacterium]MCK9333532.1 uridine kinase [Candidatus Cloacimonadota bacterium]MDD2210626.1 uridine kinase [Candidatus Cloacimonadota bacterium]
MTQTARLILIAGGTCSGKTTIAKAIGRRLTDLKTVIVSHDNYYKDLSYLPIEERGRVNFDHPDAIDKGYLVSDILDMLAGKAVNVPDYSFVTHSRNEGSLCIAEADVIILEGIFALYYKELLELSDLKIYVDTDADLRLARRIGRDIIDRGRNVENVLDQYLQTVKPSHEAFIEPSKKNADVIIPGDKEFDKVLYMLNGYLLYELVSNTRRS